MQKLRAEMVSNVMLLITVVFGGVLSVGGGVWERLHSVHVMNSTSPEPACYNTVQQGSARRAAKEDVWPLLSHSSSPPKLFKSAEGRVCDCPDHLTAVLGNKFSVLR